LSSREDYQRTPDEFLRAATSKNSKKQLWYFAEGMCYSSSSSTTATTTDAKRAPDLLCISNHPDKLLSFFVSDLISIRNFPQFANATEEDMKRHSFVSKVFNNIMRKRKLMSESIRPMQLR
jgi:hypothetical protein